VKTMEELRAEITARMGRDEREILRLSRLQRRREKLRKRGLAWIVNKKGWCCFICKPGYWLKVGSWTKAHAHVKTSKHVEIEMMEKLSR
jgi:hypothetical protein